MKICWSILKYEKSLGYPILMATNFSPSTRCKTVCPESQQLSQKIGRPAEILIIGRSWPIIIPECVTKVVRVFQQRSAASVRPTFIIIRNLCRLKLITQNWQTKTDGLLT